MGRRCSDLLPEFTDQRAQIAVTRHEASRLFGVGEGGREVAGLPTVAHERQQGLAIVRMTGCVLFEKSHGLVSTAGRVQADTIHIRISCPVRLKLSRAPQFAERLVALLEPRQSKAECVMQSCVVWRCRNGGAQYLFAITVASEDSVELCEVDRCGCKLGTEP